MVFDLRIRSAYSTWYPSTLGRLQRVLVIAALAYDCFRILRRPLGEGGLRRAGCSAPVGAKLEYGGTFDPENCNDDRRGCTMLSVKCLPQATAVLRAVSGPMPCALRQRPRPRSLSPPFTEGVVPRPCGRDAKSHVRGSVPRTRGQPAGERNRSPGTPRRSIPKVPS